MSQRFYVASPVVAEESVLDGPEAHHLTHVMRAGVGDEVVLFDGSGWEFIGRIEQIRKSAVGLRIVARHEIDRELPFRLTLAVALPKGDRQRWLVEKAVELGVTRFVPLKTSRGVAQPVESALERLRRAVVEGSKQCGRNRLMEIAEPVSSAQCFAAAPPEAVRWIAHPTPSGDGRPAVASVPRDHVVAIGPEGGFTDEEVAAAFGAGWQAVSLGPRILRVDTAAIALVAAISLWAER